MGRIDNCRGFLGRLARDVRGNTIAIMAAAMLPLAGLIGGGVDMSRLYLVKTRLQQACDAGALAGRKAMGVNTWTTGSGNGSTNDTAEKMFGANIANGQYGTNTLLKNYSESNGTVTGTGSIKVPMTIMKIFGIGDRTLRVSCSSRMEIPNTDVMFVLDVTGSMGDAIPNDPSGAIKIDTLHKAVKCFYEALEKVNTTEPCTAVTNGTTTTYTSTGDPTATTYSGTAQIRIGFMPYSVNVNVGKLLPNSFFKDNWSYQSRQAMTTPVWTYTLGNESSKTAWSAYTPASTPTSFNTDSGFSSWTYQTANQTLGSTTYSYHRTDSAADTQTECLALNNLSGSSSTLIARSDATGTASSDAGVPTAPNYPATTETITYTNSEPHTVTGLKYVWAKNGGNSSTCWLQKATGTYTKTATATSTKPTTWTQIQSFTSYHYAQRSFDISGLKASGNWNGSVSLPLMNKVTLGTYTPSGSTTSQTYSTAGPATVTWDGCIEERATIKNTAPSTNAPADWSPIPATAYDMNIDLTPTSDANTQWAPILNGAVWGRKSSGANTLNALDTTSTGSSTVPRGNYYCPVQAMRLQTWNTSPAFVTYVDSLQPTGNTYHDIGLLWGARFISPTGIFAATNTNLTNIRRHIIFMTDGDTNVDPQDYSAYGIHWWDRRQTNYEPTQTDLQNVLNARLAALCTAIKNQNTTLWVVSFGPDINGTTGAALQTCASDSKYFSATNSASLIAQFKQIASQISELRLMS